MKILSAIRVALVALTAFAGATLSSASHADEGIVSLTIYKAGWIIGGSGGGGTLNFRGRRLSALHRRPRLRPGVRRLEDRAARPRQQHLPALRRRRRLRRGRRRPRGRPRRARDRADQPEGRGAGTVRPPGRPDGERGSERAGDYAEVGERGYARSPVVVPAKAGTHSHRRELGEERVIHLVRSRAQRGMGPGRRSLRSLVRDDVGVSFRFNCQTARGRASALSRRDAPELCVDGHPPKNKRAQGRPGARCTRGLVCKMHIGKRTRAYRFSGGIPAFPAQWFTAYTALSPVTGLSCHRHPREVLLPANLTPASGRQDHTASPSARVALVSRNFRVHRIPPRVRDDRDPPLSSGETGGVVVLICPTG